MRGWVLMVCLLLVAPANAYAQVALLREVELERLLSPGTDEAVRVALMQQLVASAQSGDPHGAFYLGVLYRHGWAHPARLVDQDVESARHWLQRCVATPGCPVMALASLAELELADGQARPAMQWAQAWVLMERKLAEQSRARQPRPPTRDAPFEDTSYQAYLLKRCYDAMPGNVNRDVVGRAWFDDLIGQHGPQLEAMFQHHLASGGTVPGGVTQAAGNLEMSAENQRRKTVNPDAPMPIAPAMGLFLYRGNPAGGRGEAVQLVEALPNPAGARGLALIAREFRTREYPVGDGGERRYALLPISFNEWQHSLLPMD